MKWTRKISVTLATVAALFAAGAPNAKAQEKKPNIIVIMGDDIGMWNIGAYHRGMMAGKTPNLDKTGQGRNAVHRLLRRGKLHGGSRELHYWGTCQFVRA